MRKTKEWSIIVVVIILLFCTMLVYTRANKHMEVERFPNGWFCYDGTNYIVEYNIKYDDGGHRKVKEKVDWSEWQHAWEEYSNWKSEMEWMKEYGGMNNV